MGTRDDYQYYKDTGQSTSGNVQNSGKNTASTPYTYTPPVLVEEDQKQFQNQGGGYNYNAANLARQAEAANMKKKQIEEQQRVAEEQRQKQLQWDKAEQEYNDKNRAQTDRRLAAQEKATQAQLNKSMNNTYSPYGYDPTTGAPLNKSGYIYTPVTQPQSQQKKDTAATYVFSQPQEQKPTTNYLTPQQLALLSRNSAGGAGYNVATELLPQSPTPQRQTINGAKYLNPQQLAGLNMKQGQVPIKPATPVRGLGQTIQDYQYTLQSGKQQQGSVKNFGRGTEQSTGTNAGGESELPKDAKVVPSQDGKSKVTLLPYKKGGYLLEDLEALGMKPQDGLKLGYETQGKKYFEGYYFNRQDGKYYPVNYDKARYAIEKGADSAYDTWAYKGYNPDMTEYYKMFGTYYGYTPTWRTTAFANASGAGKSGGGYSWNAGSGSGSGNSNQQDQQDQRRYYNDFVIWRP